MNSEEHKENSIPTPHGRPSENSGGDLSDSKRAENAAIKRTKRVIVPVDFNEEADLEQAGDSAMREFMLMQQIKLFSPKCHRYEGSLKVLEYYIGGCRKMFQCFSKRQF